MPQNLVADFFISLAGGASEIRNHGLTAPDGSPLLPFSVLPDRATPIVVSDVTTTQVTFTNPTGGDLSANFRVRRYHSVSAPGSTAAFYWRGTVSGGGGGGEQQLLSTYFFDDTQAKDAAVRRYDDLPTLLAAADADLPAGVSVQIVVNGRCDWDGTGLPEGRDLTFIGANDPTSPVIGRADSLYLSGATLGGSLPAPVAIAAEGLEVRANDGSAATIGRDIYLILRGCVSGQLALVLDSTVGGAGTPTLLIENCNLTGVLLFDADTTDESADIVIRDSFLSAEGGTASASLFSMSAGAGAVRVSLTDATIDFGDNNGTDTPVLGNAGVSISARGGSFFFGTTVLRIFDGDGCDAPGAAVQVGYSYTSLTQTTPFTGNFILTATVNGVDAPLFAAQVTGRDRLLNDTDENRFPWVMLTESTAEGWRWRGPANSVFLTATTTPGKGGGTALATIQTGMDGADTVWLRAKSVYRIGGTITCVTTGASGYGAWDLDTMYDTGVGAFLGGMPGVVAVIGVVGHSITLTPAGTGFQIEVDSGSEDATWAIHLASMVRVQG